ncbi:phosphatase PAP2 family protein [Ectobacillus antri]|jgi:membrane-associated phospholipid phosphatase|uniref:Phosphatase PAP2 family protein n=1 Tax=Ectobacillus antri TaxID=2486280 RepID=A0ABT6H4A0_9BACI|nr:phosphatase PAP2 family protein [Ectobacillus antri]MDG4657489.1 phosphatase PAP2 family protein [Ectobacillus antri]MDG5753802.1 phosphatase PAP2 family protein [Ectobacillus antri]
MKINKHTYALVFIVVFAAFAGILTWKVIDQQTLLIDEWMKGRLQLLQGKESIAFFTILTEMGSEPGIIGTLVGASIWLATKRRYISIAVFVIAVVVAQLLNKVLKNIIARERPSLNEAIDAVSYSFPSGHAMVGLVTYGFLAALLIRAGMKKSVVITGAALLILLVGLSRIVLSVHYPSDILGGYCLGGMLLIVFLYADAYANSRQKKRGK